MTIKIAQPSEEAGAIAVLTLAFSVDPMVRWSLPNSKKYLAAFPLIAKAFGGNAFEGGTAYMGDNFAGVALWLPPGAGSDEESLVRLFDENVSNDVKKDLPGIFEQMEKFRPAEPHWYLPMIGVDPAYQNTGVGSALMKEALKVVDKDGSIAYLESSNPRNISLYERHGFEVIGEIRSGSSPILHPMLRKAR
ncbi:GNAT family N-acetyltransferase [Niabella sp. CC-SYL272]|uniref:GNAT family N-acetyltransferase n=1 Tax=Niabella agricola TaxID=2891571 RepID=UPI001F1FC5CE|nr:N-acetyltransferase [Niabella agricola]MCF3109636.1 GNAT family N-acetyltransferase [Niabella agricola]